MARPLRIEYECAFYHVIQRGIEKRDIFISDEDKEKFLSYFDFARSGYGAIIHTYVLMNNHYHIILETPRGNMSKIMHYINSSYAAYYNAKRKRVGPLYQGRYKAILIEKDAYLNHLSGYIHLNPVRAHIVKDPKEYRWSSYNCFTSLKNNPPEWLNISFILSMFDNDILKAKKLYKDFVMDDINSHKSILKENTIKGFILGTKDFAQDIISRFVNTKEDPEVPIIRELKQRKYPSLENIRQAVEENIASDKKLQRKFSLYFSRKYSQKTLKEIASFYGKIKDTGVSQAFIRTNKLRLENKDIDNQLVSIEKEMCRVET